MNYKCLPCSPLPQLLSPIISSSVCAKMSRRQVSHSCGHTSGENIEPDDLSLWTEPISVPQRCWRCLGERHRPCMSSSGGYRVMFIGYLDVPSDTPSEAETTHNVAAPASASRTNTRSCHAPHLLFVPVFNPRDIDHNPYFGSPSAQESDAERTSSTSPRSRSRTANRSAQVVDGVLYTSPDNSGVPVPDFQSTTAASSPATSREGAVDVATLCNNTTSSSSRVSADDHAAQPEPEPEPEPHKQTNSSSPHFDGSEIDFSGLSIRPDADGGFE